MCCLWAKHNNTHFVSRQLSDLIVYQFWVLPTSPIAAAMFTTPACLYRAKMVHKFVARTVIVKDNNVEGALRVLNRIMGSEGLFDIYRRTRSYEKPFNTRRRVNWQMCKAIYDEDMDRKIKFVMPKNRANPNRSFIF